MEEEQKDDGMEEISYYDNDLGEMKFRVSRKRSRLCDILMLVGVLMVVVAGIVGYCFDTMADYAIGLGVLGAFWILIFAPLLADWFGD